MRKNTYSRFEIPPAITTILFILSLIFSIGPYLPGLDFGIFKVPQFPVPIVNILKVIGPIFLFITMAGFIPVWPEQKTKELDTDQIASAKDIQTGKASAESVLSIPDKSKRELLIKPELTNVHVNWKRKIHAMAGIAERDKVFDSKPIGRKVFAIELLEEPLILKRQNEKIEIQINRKNVNYALFSNPGKDQLCRSCFDRQPHMTRFAEDLDQNVNDFLLGKNDFTKIEIILKDLPLRWASGGVFCIVEHKGRNWTPFFFRDIKPAGWNIPLGASETDPEVNSPWNLLWREFMEEFLIINTHPREKSKLQVRNPVFPKITELTMSQRQASNLMQKHIDLRYHQDMIDLKINHQDMLEYDIVNTHMKLKITSDLQSTETKDILIAINPFELGIEVVAVVKCRLNPDDYILDGEILESENNVQELVRMPVALISHDYLRKAFSKDRFKLDYDSSTQSSVKVPDIPENDIIIFDWDLSNRQAIVAKQKKGIGVEYSRYKEWQKTYGEFFRHNNLNHFGQALGLFTPTSAKIASYYFA